MMIKENNLVVWLFQVRMLIKESFFNTNSACLAQAMARNNGILEINGISSPKITAAWNTRIKFTKVHQKLLVFVYILPV